MRRSFYTRRLAIFPAALLFLTLALYTWLVTPRRFFQCLGEPARYLTRSYSGEEIPPGKPLPDYQPVAIVRLLVNGDQALPEMLDMIASAEQSIRWQVMLFAPDEAGFALGEALASAARRGVTVQLSFNLDQTVNGTIADGFSREKRERLNREMDRLLALLRTAGVDVRANPAEIDFSLEGVNERAAAVQRSIQRSACVSFNHYDHRKLFIVDDRRAVIGGMNVGNSYLYHEPVEYSADMVAEALQRAANGLPEPWEKWFDTAVVFEGPLIEDLVAEFNWKWSVLGGQEIPYAPAAQTHGASAGRLLVQRPGMQQIGARIFDLIESAEREIWVASPFVSYDPVLEALMAASRRGVRVVFIYPNAHQEMPLSGRIFRERVNDLLEAGVELYFNDLRMAHTKLLIVDGQTSLVGSFNLNHRSFRHDLENVVEVSDPGFAQQVIERVFMPYQNISRPVRSPINTPWNPVNWFLQPFS
jgi:cardiolipin synthase A/B